MKMRPFQSNVEQSSSHEPLNDSPSDQHAQIYNLCEEEQPEMIDSKKNLCQDQKFKINYICGDDVGQHITTGADCDHTKQLNDLDSKITQCIVQNYETHLKLDGFRRTLDLIFRKLGIEEILKFDDIDENNCGTGEDDFKTSSSAISSKFDIVDNKIAKCILSNKITNLKIDNLQKSLDVILKNIENALMNSEPSEDPTIDNDQQIIFNFPISSVNELNKLEEELQHNEVLMSNLVAKFTKIAGDSGNKCATKVGVKIIEKILSAKLLTKFTWIGRTSGTKKIKLPFITYSSIFNLCLQIISKADRSFDTIACENFLKNNILKHSSMRLSRKFNKKVNHRKSSDETWCTKSKLVLKEPTIQLTSKIQNVSEQYLDTKEDIFDEEIVDSKENIINLLDNSPEIEEGSNQWFPPNSFLNKCINDSKIDMMDSKISHCIESNTEIHSKIDNLQETLNIILNKIGISQNFEPEPAPSSTPAPISEIIDDEDDLNSFRFPIISVPDLQDLNKKLSTSENFEEKMINKFVLVVGRVKNMSTQRFGLEVVESVISPHLLVKYSWTGRSKSLKPKLAFMKYQHVVNFFQKIISKFDKRFTRKECEDFLRFTVFKYINMRAARHRRKFEDPNEYFFHQDVNQEFNTTSSSIEDVYMKNGAKGQ